MTVSKQISDIPHVFCSLSSPKGVFFNEVNMLRITSQANMVSRDFEVHFF